MLARVAAAGAWAGLILLGGAACERPEREAEAETEAEDAALRERLVGVEWRLVRVEEPGQPTLEPSAEAAQRPWIRFSPDAWEPGREPAAGGPESGDRPGLRDPDLRQVEGHGGCNSFAGSYRLFPDAELAVRDLLATEIFCTPADVMAVESAFLSTLASAESYRFAADTLVLASERGMAWLRSDGI